MGRRWFDKLLFKFYLSLYVCVRFYCLPAFVSARPPSTPPPLLIFLPPNQKNSRRSTHRVCAAEGTPGAAEARTRGSVIQRPPLPVNWNDFPLLPPQDRGGETPAVTAESGVKALDRSAKWSVWQGEPDGWCFVASSVCHCYLPHEYYDL